MRSNDATSTATVDAVTAELVAVRDRFTRLALDPAPGDDAARIDRIALLEQMRAAVAAAQQAEMVAFGRSQVEQHLDDVRVDPRRVGRGIADQIALACGVSPFTGSRRLEVARALHADLPATRALLAAGQVSEQVAEQVVSQTRHLNPEQRRLVDKQAAAGGIEGLSGREASALVGRLAYEADRQGYVQRGRTARKDRRVGLRPAPDTMSVLSALLPVEQGVACWGALRKHADALIGTGDERTRDQICADTLVERVTGQAAATDVQAEVGIVIPVEALLDPDSAASAEVVGQGPIPADIALHILAQSQGRTWLRRLFTRPGKVLVGGDARRRRFDGFLARLIAIRDGGRCRDPFCDAPIAHTDHIRTHRESGARTFENGRGVCARGNYVREMPGWAVEVIEDGLGNRRHTVRVTTPTGHCYDSTAPPT